MKPTRFARTLLPERSGPGGNKPDSPPPVSAAASPKECSGGRGVWLCWGGKGEVRGGNKPDSKNTRPRCHLAVGAAPPTNIEDRRVRKVTPSSTALLCSESGLFPPHPDPDFAMSFVACSGFSSSSVRVPHAFPTAMPLHKSQPTAAETSRIDKLHLESKELMQELF